MLSEIAPLFIFIHQPPEHQVSARVPGLCLSATNNVNTPGFILIVSLVISLWLLWPYHWLYRFDRSDRIALAVLLIVLLWSLWPHRSGRIVDRIRVWKCSLLLVLFSLIAPQTASGPRRDSPPWWITHLYLIIQQDLSAYIEPLDHLELRLDLLF